MKNWIQFVGLTLFLATGASAQNYAGIYFGDLAGTYYNNNAGVAVFVNTNNRATLVGSAFASDIGSANIGLYAQFKVQPDGTWNCNTNGFSASGQIFANGSLVAELDSDGGGVSTISDGLLQSDLGVFQNQAGYYAGTWTGEGSGQVFAILSASGNLAYCVGSTGNPPFDGGGLDQISEADNSFDSISVNNAEVLGVLTKATRTIGGVYTNLDTLTHGRFSLSRASFVAPNLPPTITSPPLDQTVRYGDNATFYADATGASPLHYQWYSNDVALAGATHHTLVVNNVQAAFDGTIYKIVVTNFVNSAEAEALLTARPETVPPTVVIVSPTSGQRVTDAILPVSGTATDNNQVDSVYYSINGGPDTLASGTANWTGSVTLRAGTNVFAAYAMDTSGNLSPTRRRTFLFIVPSTLTLNINGLGTITRSFTGDQLAVGRAYTVTAVPGVGQVFSNWLANGSVVSSAATYSFLMETNLALTANFTPNPFQPAQGYFTGLFGQTNRSHAHSGFFSLTLGDHGAFTAALNRGTNSYPFSGRFSVAGYASRTVMIGAATGTVAMTLDLAGAQKLTGTVGTPGWTADLLARRAVFDAATNPATQFRGSYTLIFPGNDNASVSPGGDGYGAVRVTLGGNTMLGGALADGQPLSQSVPLSSTGDWAFYAPLYGGAGSAWGWLKFDANHPAAHVDGTVSWIRPALPGKIYYPLGFTNAMPAGGSRYAAPTDAHTRVIGLTNGIAYFEGGNLSTPITNEVRLTVANQVLTTSQMSMSINVANGTFSGSARVPGTTRTNTFNGALLQDENAGYGYFLGTDQSGRVFFGAP